MTTHHPHPARRSTDGVTDAEIERAMEAALPVAPDCQRCEGTGRLEVYEHSGYGRRLGEIECDAPWCVFGRIEEPPCEACGDIVSVPEEDPRPHFCEVSDDSCWFLCDSCRRDPENHLARCKS